MDYSNNKHFKPAKRQLLSTKSFLWLAAAGIFLVSLSAFKATDNNLKENFIKGDTEIASVNALSFGPEGILFIGDSKNASIYALDTKDAEVLEKAAKINLEGFDIKIAAALGTSPDKIKITDMAVNPASKNVYFSVNAMDGTPVILRLKGEELENVSLKEASYSKIALNDPISTDAKDRRGRSQRVWAISDMNYHKGKVLVTGLSNKEFGSTFRSIPFPFTEAQDAASLEIWHAAHGRFETTAPVKTFAIVELEGKDHLMASYTCTPLVLFPLEQLKSGKHTKGRTIAELGAGNSPLDMITFQKNGKPYFLMSNTNRAVMNIPYDEIVKFKESMTEPVEGYGAEGLPYISLPMVNVLQMDNLDAENIVTLRRTSDGNLLLRSGSTARI